MYAQWILAILLAATTSAFAQTIDGFAPRLEDDTAAAHPLSEGSRKVMRRFGVVFDRIDTDGSGAIDADEWAATVAKMGDRGFELGTRLFEGADMDKDGLVTRVEWNAARDRLKDVSREPGQIAERVFAQMDIDGDGMLSIEEFKSGMAVLRARYDDGYGRLDRGGVHIKR